jgi:HD-GYP domain-containing protein (c-di-GMP phosphodiesterase class II)
MLKNFSGLTQKYLENAKNYNALTDAVKINANLTRGQLADKLKEIAFTGNQILEDSKALMLALGLIDKSKNLAPEFTLEDAYALYDFARKCNKSGDLPWSDEEKYDEIDDSFLALEVLDIVVKTATQYGDLALKIRASERLSHHCLNNAVFLAKKGKEICDDVLKTAYDSIPCKTFKDAKAKLTYALIVFCYSPFNLILDADTESDYDALFESFRKAESFNAKYMPPLNHGLDLDKFASDKQADAFETVRDEAWNVEWEKPEIKAWAATLMEGATREQARELAKRWCNYAANINYEKSSASKLCGFPRSTPMPDHYAKELNTMYCGLLGKQITLALSDPCNSANAAANAETIKKELADGKRANLLIGWVITSIHIMKDRGEQIGSRFKLLRDISNSILSIESDKDWYNQILRLQVLFAACATLCKYIDEMPEEEKTLSLQIAYNTMAYIRQQSKEVKNAIGHYLDEFCVVVKSLAHMFTRRAYIELLMGIASQDHISTYAHSLVVARLNERITGYALDFATELVVGISDTKTVEDVKAIASDKNLRGAFIEEMELAGLGHDLGKIFQILSVSQCARPLTDTEYSGIIRKHNELGAVILDVAGFELKRACAKKHHAFADGNGHRGYPDNAGVKHSPYKAAINITHISDVLSAISDNLGRYYAKPRTVDEAFTQILKDSEYIDGNEELNRDIVKFILENRGLNGEVREILTSYNEEAYWKSYNALIKP